MSSTTETGHAKNVANFLELITYCEAFGPAYNPVKESLKITQVQSLHQSSLTSLENAKTFKTKFDNATNTRRMEFENLKTFSTRIINAFAVSGVNKFALDDLKSVNKKIQGISSKKTESPENTENQIKNISTSQQSYDMLIDHFSKIIQTLKEYGEYKPNEEDLRVESLHIKLDNMKTKNMALILAYTEYNNALIQRNQLLYDPMTGLIQTAKEVKQYVKSLFGASSPQFKQVNGIEFKKQSTD
jgi:hypothetical protein